MHLHFRWVCNRGAMISSRFTGRGLFKLSCAPPPVTKSIIKKGVSFMSPMKAKTLQLSRYFSPRATMDQEKGTSSTQQPRVVGNFCIEALLGKRDSDSRAASDCGSDGSISPPISPGCEGETPPPPPMVQHHLPQHHPPAVVLSRFYPPQHHGPHPPHPHPAGTAGLYYPGAGGSAFHPLLGELRGKSEANRPEYNGEYSIGFIVIEITSQLSVKFLCSLELQRVLIILFFRIFL